MFIEYGSIITISSTLGTQLYLHRQPIQNTYIRTSIFLKSIYVQFWQDIHLLQALLPWKYISKDRGALEGYMIYIY